MGQSVNALPPRDDVRAAGTASGAQYRPLGSVRAMAWQDMRSPQQIGRWQALARCSVQPNPFCEHWFLLPSLEALDPRGTVKLLCLEVDGQLAGLMPLCRQTSYYGHPLPHMRNWLHANAFSGQPLVAAGMEALFWREVLAWCDSHAGTSLFLHLQQLPGDGVQHEALKLLVASEERPAATVLDEARAMLATSLDAETYLGQSLTQKKRKELRRQQRRLGEEGELETRRSRDARGVDEWIEEFLALETAGWKGRAGSALASGDATATMFRQTMRAAAELGRLERLSLMLDGKPVAMLATLLAAPGAYSFKTAFDEDYARFSPGVLLQLENLAIIGDPEIAWVDSCAVEDHKMIDHLWREKRRMASHSIGIGGGVRRSIFGQLARHETGKQPRGIT